MEPSLLTRAAPIMNEVRAVLSLSLSPSLLAFSLVTRLKTVHERNRILMLGDAVAGLRSNFLNKISVTRCGSYILNFAAFPP